MSQNKHSSFSALGVRVLRRIRYLLLLMYAPVEQLVFRISGIPGFPPIHLRRTVGATAAPDGSSAQFLILLKMVAGLNNGSRVLDIGCGCGLLELAIEDHVKNGRVVGVDIYRPSIAWATRRITSRSPHITFDHADIHHPEYWPSGRLSVEAYFKTLNETGFDIVVAKSLFTHMLDDELPFYLSEIAHRLAPGGKALTTFFLLNAEQGELGRQGRNAIEFHRPESDAPYAFRRRSAPAAAVAYDEAFIDTLLAQAGLVCSTRLYGTWSGRQSGLNFQDILVVQRAG